MSDRHLEEYAPVFKERGTRMLSKEFFQRLRQPGSRHVLLGQSYQPMRAASPVTCAVW